MFIDTSHSQLLLRGLAKLRLKQELCDVRLLVGSDALLAHRVVLASISTYFKAMFTGALEESRLREIRLHEVDGKSVAQLLDFAYTGTISISTVNVQCLLTTSHMMGISQVSTACCDLLVRNLHPSNCLGFLCYAQDQCLEELTTACMRYVEDHFIQVSECNEFLSLSCGDLSSLLSNDFVNVVGEEDVFSALERWHRHVPFERTTEFFTLARYLRLSACTASYLLTLKSHPLLRSAEGYKLQLTLQAELNLRSNPFRLLDEQLFNGASQRRQHNRLFVFGGKDGLLRSLESCEIYNMDEGTWRSCADLPGPLFNSAAASVNGSSVYVAGGMTCDAHVPYRSTTTAEVLHYNITENRGQQADNMLCKRASHTMVAHKNTLYAIGGYDGTHCLRSVERFDTGVDGSEWMSAQELNFNRSCFAAVLLDEYIYVLGGQGTSQAQCTVERLDTTLPNAGWEIMPSMGAKRTNFGAVQLHGFIYVIGGHDGFDYLRSVERFDPCSSEWVVVAPLPTPRMGLSVAIGPRRSEVYAVGGHDGSRYLDSVVVYDPRTDKWRPSENMTSSRCYMSIATAWMRDEEIT